VNSREDSIVVGCDVETGGLDEDKHTLLQVGFYTEIDGERFEENILLDPTEQKAKVTTEKSLEINDVDIEENREVGVTPREARHRVEMFFEELKEKKGCESVNLLFHNAHFDLGFLEALYGHKSYPWHYHTYDTLPVASFLRTTGWLKSHTLKLDDLAPDHLDPEDFGGDFRFHDAVEDAKAAYKLYDYLIDIIPQGSKI